MAQNENEFDTLGLERRGNGKADKGGVPAQEDVAVVGVEVTELLLGKAGELLPLQDEALHAIQILVPLLHQLLRLETGGACSCHLYTVVRAVAWQPRGVYLGEGHGGLPGEEQRREVSLHLVLLLRVLLHLRGNARNALKIGSCLY